MQKEQSRGITTTRTTLARRICTRDSHYPQVLQSREGISLHALQLIVTDDSAKEIRVSYTSKKVFRESISQSLSLSLSRRGNAIREINIQLTGATAS